MPALILPDRSLIRVEGADVQHFLQNLITTNIDAIAPGEAWPAALLTPQGKILFDFLISKSGETGYDCDIRADQAADFIRRLTLYKLRASVEFNLLEDQPVIAAWDEDAPQGALRDRRFPEEAHVWRLYGNEAMPDGKPADWNAVRIAHGVAESGSDFALSDVFPHDVLMDRNGGVDFRKGCYVGQEVVSRMQHRGTARRRVVTLTAQTDLPARTRTENGNEDELSIMAGGKPVGSIGSTAGGSCARNRADRPRRRRDGGEASADRRMSIAVTLTLPGWTGLSLSTRGHPNTLRTA